MVLKTASLYVNLPLTILPAAPFMSVYLFISLLSLVKFSLGLIFLSI